MTTYRFIVSACGACLALALAGCGAGSQDTVASAPKTVRLAAATVQGAAPAATAFSGNLSQYTISGANLTVTDNITGAVRQVAATDRLQFADTGLTLDLAGIPGQAYRIYQAAFNRKPDIGGLSYWIGAMDAGVTLTQVTQSFINSAEFINLYGSPNNSDFVTLLYANVLHRLPDQGGADYWLSYLNGTDAQGVTLTRADVLSFFSVSDENKANVLDSIKNGIEYWPAGFSAPTNQPGEFTGGYNGSAKGSDSGNMIVNIDGSGAMAILIHLNGANVDLSGSGTVATGGKFTSTLAGGSVKATLTGSINLAQRLATGFWTITSAGGGSGVFNASMPVVTPPPPPPSGPTFSTIQAIIQQRCLPCHSAHPTIAGFNPAPLGIMFDTEAQIRGSVSDINTYAVRSHTMPYANMTNMTDAERATIGSWIAAGTP
jgi:hypothetical protein